MNLEVKLITQADCLQTNFFFINKAHTMKHDRVVFRFIRYDEMYQFVSNVVRSIVLAWTNQPSDCSSSSY